MYEASFIEDDVFVSVDILERRDDGYVLVEVKSTLDARRQGRSHSGRSHPTPRAGRASTAHMLGNP